MILKLCKLTGLLASVLLLSCNLDSDSSAIIATDAALAPGLVNGTVTYADGSVTIKSLNNSVQVAWQTIPNASGYHIYYASEPITEFNNYAVFKDSKWLSNVTSPTLIPNLENQLYSYITVTAIINGGRATYSHRNGSNGQRYSTH